MITLGLIGHPLSHSLSAKLHQAALHHSQISGEYLLFDLNENDLELWLKALPNRGIRGFNVTIPYKQKLFLRVDELSPEAKKVKAVNTVLVKPNGRLLGHNTDIAGFASALQGGSSPATQELEGRSAHLVGKTALVIGAGGSARAVIAVLSQMEVKSIKLKARDLDKLRGSLDELSSILQSRKTKLMVDDELAREELSIVVNASPLGLPDTILPAWAESLLKSLSRDCLFFDLNYQKDDSCPQFVNLARSHGIAAVDGKSMLIEQARLSFQFWTDAWVSSDVMRQALMH